jgi:hypothetical protein
MSRRRALRLAGGALVGAAFPAFQARRAGATSLVCINGATQGGTVPCSPVFPGGKIYYCCTPTRACCGQPLGGQCCLPGESCVNHKCVKCPSARKCGKKCCKPKQLCRSGKCCDNCGGNGTCCDLTTTFCCRDPSDPKSPGSCCKKDQASCCRLGPPDSKNWTCCPKPNKCTRQLPATRGGLTPDSPRVCCPPERQVPVDETHPNDINACCAPGQLSLGGKLLVGQGIQGACCDENKICGSGASITCCQTGQSCVGGTCA